MLGLVFAALTATSWATRFPAREETPTNSTFVHKTGSGSLAFAVAVAKNNGDFFFHIEAPAEYSWVAIGTGEKMSDSLMWVVYRSGNGTGATLSPRFVDDHVEPSYNEKIDCRIVTGNGISNGVVKANNNDVLAVNGVCTNITKIATGDGKVDLTSTRQNFIFGLGPTGKSLQSDSKSAGIRRHKLYGQFSMDLSKATVDNTGDVDEARLGSVDNWQTANAQLVGGVTSDFDWAEPVHALFMGGTFVVLFPIGVVFLRLLERVQWHAWMQGFGVVVAILGVGVGIYLGREYNHSKSINSAHQIVGLLVVVFALVQFGLGLFHHRLYKRHKRPTMLGKIHLYLGPLVLIVGAVNGFLGFSFAGEGDDNIWYGVVVGVIFLALVGALIWARRRRAVKPAAREDLPLSPGAYVRVEDPREAQPSVPLRNM